MYIELKDNNEAVAKMEAARPQQKLNTTAQTVNIYPPFPLRIQEKLFFITEIICPGESGR
jgi:hypothetical protein